MTRQITKASWRVERGDRIAEWVARAIRTALTPPARPVVLTVPENLLYGPVEPGTGFGRVGAAHYSMCECATVCDAWLTETYLAVRAAQRRRA